MAAALLSFAALAQTARDLKARPAWDVDEASSRLMVVKAEDDYFLVTLPAKDGEKPVAAVKVFLAEAE
ncbi:MAG: hypothetical protein PHU80_02955, partial [Kiritimatiellae bacterium]|nr:hypothetical protein [Kiritimatiellia bacterium]